MKKSSKRYGLKKEREYKKMLEGEGYTVVPSKGSFGPMDGAAFNETHLRLFQIKATRKKYYSFKKEIEEIRNFKRCPPGTLKEIVICHSYKHKKNWIREEIK